MSDLLLSGIPSTKLQRSLAVVHVRADKVPYLISPIMKILELSFVDTPFQFPTYAQAYGDSLKIQLEGHGSSGFD